MAELIYAGDGGAFKVCTKCGDAKPVSCFAIGNTSVGLRAACKMCACAIEAARRVGQGILPIGTFCRCVDCGEDYPKRSGPSVRCIECADAEGRRNRRAANARYEEKRTEPRKRNPEERKRANARYAEKHPDAAKIRSAEYYSANREEVNRKSRERNKTPKRKAFMFLWDAQYRAQPKQRIDQRMKTQIRLAIKEQKAGRSWESIVGYTLDDLCKHLERQFLPGMTWENISEWHIDHIVPRKHHEYECESDKDFKACWALTNLRPLWARENISKGGKRTLLL